LGGEAFKGPDGESLTTSIRREEVEPTLRELLRGVLRPVGIDSFVPLGSTGKRDMSGDLDIAIGPVPTEDPKALKAIKDGLLKSIQGVVGADRAKLVGQNIAIMAPVAGSRDRFVQVDVMLSGNPDLTGWLMSGTGSGVKGVYRNLLLSYIASVMSKESGGTTKVTVSFPGGIQVTEGGVVTLKRTEDPQVILSTLGINARPSETTSFEDLVTILAGDPKFQGALVGYEAYISRYLQDPHTAAEAAKAVAVIKNATGLREAIRRIIGGRGLR
jgi:hypothetical protein